MISTEKFGKLFDFANRPNSGKAQKYSLILTVTGFFDSLGFLMKKVHQRSVLQSHTKNEDGDE